MEEGAIRIVCYYKGDEVRPESVERVKMLALESDPLEGYESQVGFWLELRGEPGKLLYRQIMPDPFRPDVEVFVPPEDAKEPSGSIFMTRRDEIDGHFVLLVPDLPDAQEIALVRADVEPQQQTREVRDVAVLAIPK